MSINPSMFDTKGDSAATYNAWQVMRNLANIAFIVAFLMIIYSQLTGLGISNYGIKKLLPKLFITALLVNLSFYICAVAVDASNIVGSSLHSLLVAQVATTGGDVGSNLGTWDKITAWLLAGGVSTLAVGGAAIAVGAYGFMGALALLIPLAVIALVAALTVVAVLVARQAFIIILVVISPLAFVAFLLPNTENWFSKWRKTLFTLLLMYPLIALLFGGTQLAASIIRNSADDALVYVLSLVVLVIPLFSLPLLLKFSGGVLGRVAGVVNNPNKGPFDRMKKGGAKYAERRRGFKMGDSINRTEGLRTGSGRVLGNTDSRRRKVATWASGIGNVNSKTSEEKDKNAKASLESAQRNYVANRAIIDESYANSLAGGNSEMASLVKAYSINEVDQERRKDREAQKTILVHDNIDFKTLSNNLKGGTYNGAQEEAAMQRFFELANSDGVQDMIEHIGGDLETQHGSERAKELRKIAADSLSGHGLKPIDLSASNLTKLKNGEGIASESKRIASTIGDGKTTAEHIGKMDIDEMNRWNKQLADNPSLLVNSSEEVIKATREAIVKAEGDARINVKFGDRERKALAEMKALLSQAESTSNTAKSAQDTAASTYGPTI